MNIRPATHAGSFYEGTASSCRYHAEKLLRSVTLPNDLPAPLYGGIVPHAGWMYSGTLAATTMKALNHDRPMESVLLLGADHVGVATCGEVFDSGVWQTPLGEVAIDEDLAAELLAGSPLLRAFPDAHGREHSLEVQIPLLQLINPNVKIVPITVPPFEDALELGRDIAEVIAGMNPRPHILASTDLTHHGGHFSAPGGHGREGVAWSVQNDRRLLTLMQDMRAEKILPEACSHENACGAGGVAACVAACKELGATAGRVLEYTNSYEIIHAMYPDDLDDTTVGYASVVFY